jgi:hypothetical protein
VSHWQDDFFGRPCIRPGKFYLDILNFSTFIDSSPSCGQAIKYNVTQHRHFLQLIVLTHENILNDVREHGEGVNVSTSGLTYVPNFEYQAYLFQQGIER